MDDRGDSTQVNSKLSSWMSQPCKHRVRTAKFRPRQSQHKVKRQKRAACFLPESLGDASILNSRDTFTG